MAGPLAVDQRKIRANQIERAVKLINSGEAKIDKKRPTDYKRFISKTSVTQYGEAADKASFSIDSDIIANEEQYDGFYGVCTDLEDDSIEIIKINHRRWEFEECFRIMKTEFKARPFYLSDDERIKAHFITCFIALVLYRLLEKKLGDSFTCETIIDGLRELNFLDAQGQGFIPAYSASNFTDAQHDAFSFRTDTEIITLAAMNKILSSAK